MILEKKKKRHQNVWSHFQDICNKMKGNMTTKCVKRKNNLLPS